MVMGKELNASPEISINFNTFSKDASESIIMPKSIAFVYIQNEWTEKRNQEDNSIYNSCIILRKKKVKDLYNKSK